MAKIMKIARRGFLFGSIALAGGVAFGWWKYKTPYGNPLETDLSEGAATLNPYVIIDASGVTVIAPRAEMGQGIHTTLAALVAEEMDLDFATIKVIHGPASGAYYNGGALREGAPFLPTDESWMAETVRDAMDIPSKFLGMQITGGSSSIPDAYDKMRLAGAGARAALLEAAALRLGVNSATLATDKGAVIAPDGSRIAYGDLAQAAAGITLSTEPTLKNPADWKLLGRSLPRVEMLGKVTGTAIYTGDLRLPGMRFATVKMNPRLGGAMIGFDAKAAEAMAGVEKIVPLGNGVGVIAATTWQALQAAEAITFDWGPAPYPASSAEISAMLTASFDAAHQDSTKRDEGDVEKALVGDLFEAAYEAPYLAHATMEPMTAVAYLQEGAMTIWVGTQLPTQVVKEAAALTGLPETAITVETMLMGGGFGRRAEMDMVKQVIQLAQAMPGTPISLMWSREEDMSHDVYRPAAMAKLRAKLGANGIEAYDFATVSSSVIESQAGRLGLSVPGPDQTIVQGAFDQPYAFPNLRVTGYRAPAMVPVGSWRSVGGSQNGFFFDTGIDELAHLAKADPLEFRLRHITHAPSRAVLESVGKLSDWGNTPAGRARGVGFSLSFGVPSAQVIEVEQTDAGLRMTGAWAVVDVGVALDPRNLEAQVSGAMIFGLSAAIRGQITFADGKAEQQTFWDFEPLRIHQIPPIEVQVLQGQTHIRGIGEPGTPPAAPALGNAIFALTGQRLRRLPFSQDIAFA